MSKKSGRVGSATQEQSKTIIKTIDKYLYSYGATNLFYDFIDYCMHMLSMGTIPMPRELSDKDTAIMNELFLCLQEVDPYEDPFGDVYEYLVSSSKASALGQFFTPMHVCDFMALMILGEPEDIQIKGHEPSSGSGRNVLAFMKHYRKAVREKDYHNANCIWWCIDLDPLCAKMTALNCVLNDIDSVIFHGDTLALNMYAVYTVERIPLVKFPVLVKHEGENFNQLVSLLKGSISAGYKKEPEPKREEQVTLFALDEKVYHEKRATQVKQKKPTNTDENQMLLF